VTERSHLSIGEVLNLLQDEFPDITISKIRFLESQGLLDPERTPSGYRKFYEDDIERLRWILRQQKENFLPLKVIKDRLATGQLDDPAPAPAPEPPEEEPTILLLEPDPPAPAVEVVAEPEPEAPARSSAKPAGRSASRTPARSGSRTTRRRAAPADEERDPGLEALSALREHDATGVSMTQDEVLAAAGLTAKQLAELERFGLVAGRSLGNTVYYGDDALLVAQLAAGFMDHGVEARHLRMYKVAAEREAGVFEQLVMPLLKQRNPGARQQATDRLDELAGLGERLRAAMLRQALQENLGTTP
jgi:DNA-binding transcriptional MerR regulator